MEHSSWAKDAFVYLVAAGVLVPLFHRARVGAVVGFILIGAMLGPHGLGQVAERISWIEFVTIRDAERVTVIGEIGIVFLLFLLGMEFSGSKLWSLRREVFGVGLSQVVLCGIAMAAVAMLSGLEGGVALVVGFALAMSSTAVVMQILLSERRALAPLGRAAIAVLLFQDLAVVPILLAAQILGSHEDGILALVALALAKAVAAVGVILIAGRFVLAPLVSLAAGTGSRELIMAITCAVLALTAGLTQAGGLSAALGAFLAGMLLSGTPYKHQISVDLEPFKGLLIGVFFVSVGMSVDFAAVFPRLPYVLASVLVLILVKITMTYVAARLFKVDRPLAGEVALLLAQTGEFAFVVLGLLASGGLIDAERHSALVTLVTLSLVATPLLARLGGVLGRALARQGEAVEAPTAPPGGGHVVIGGFGRVGRIVAEALEQEGVPFVALDADAARVRAERAAGRQVFLGDASRGELLERVHCESAVAFVVTLDAAEAADAMVRAIKRHRPDAIILARVKDAAHAKRLAALGASYVIPETVEASLQLSARLLEALGLPEADVTERIEAAREKERLRIAQGVDEA
ncbi:cation:proton antiporter [Aquabacter spiritensis]|uniref:Kef-type potassium/proton antiporter (CPA2 family) n=1 Tax=Aquabacter spiritensis TaxID=933073 RepID=A0A4R3LL85_9HYPH|nr:cation:proton antiporter [Aquabacter spiritensis]TCT01062.1 Kef-type potassium/proton antiporter (CPA2 family) [Aquabacter spiritensis]